MKVKQRQVICHSLQQRIAEKETRTNKQVERQLSLSLSLHFLWEARERGSLQKEIDI